MRRGAALALAALALGGCGGGAGASSGALEWEAEPELYEVEGPPPEGVVTGEVVNNSLRPVDVPSSEVRPVTAGGDEVEGSATFAEGFVHGLYPPTREPSELPDSELTRLGRLAQLEPGERVRLTVSWRVPPGAEAPARVDYGEGSLPIP